MELVIGTSSGALSVALIDGAALVAEHHDVIGRGHAETVVAVVARLVGPRGSAVHGIVVDVGPGSFTGVRIGIAAARALGLGWAVPVAGVGSLALVAAAAFALDPADTVVAVADAGRGRVYWQVFTRDGGPADAAQASVAAAVVVPAGAILAGTAAAHVAGRRVAIDHPRAADARWLDRAARTAPLPLYLGAEPVAA
jgi:tRNA threonylcarbamoyl adenosine modification protein YeaZ